MKTNKQKDINNNKVVINREDNYDMLKIAQSIADYDMEILLLAAERYSFEV